MNANIADFGTNRINALMKETRNFIPSTRKFNDKKRADLLEKNIDSFLTELEHEINIHTKKIKNFNKLHEYSQLEYNWNDHRAEPFDKQLINLAWTKINELEIQPKVFPTAADSIQLEYEKENGDYLEFEIYTDRIEVFRIIGENEEEFDLNIEEDLNKIVNEFHGK